MVRNEGAGGNAHSVSSRSRLGSLKLRFRGSWLESNWHTVVILAIILFIAFFVRAYFGYSLSVDNGYAVSGGSDSYYHERVIEYVMDTGQHLVRDQMLNYPFGVRNPRPPLYDWSVAVGASLLSSLTGLPESDALGLSLILSTAVWGTLTVIPVYLMGRAAFGNKAGLIAALLFALMPGHIQRSVLSNADHDAMVLFFAVWAFYFLMKSLMEIKGEKWVSSWRDRKAILNGLKSYLKQNQISVIYAVLGGICIAAVAMIWTGFAYLVVIILAYFLVQLFINLFKKMDSMGVLIAIFFLMSTAFLIMAPVYWQMNYWSTWFDVPVYLFLASLLVGLIFVVTRDYPWTFVLPCFIIIVAAGLAVLYFFMPNVFEAIITGQGYFVKSKLYSTISEAQAPNFSNLVLSFGMVTFWLAFIGVVWAAIRIPKNLNHWLVFLVVWSGVSMFMAVSAGRFMFNAAPAFAVTAGWILAIVIDKLKFEEIPKFLTGFRGSPLVALRKAIKIRHILGAFFLVVMILLPNVWYAVDAGIPANLKAEYSKQVYQLMPDFMRPPNFDEKNGTAWYFGAFSYSIPSPNDYWPSAWSWFAQQDSDVYPVSSRPAFLSWWDYGFEAVREGKHPTVADNFQNAYQFAGSFITCQNESDAIALMIIRTLEKTGVGTNETIRTLLEAHGVDAAKVDDILTNPAKYVEIVKDNPDIYGPYDYELSAQNAKYAAASVELAKIGEEALVGLYHDLRVATGIEIGYFAIDSRLFPFSALSANILYAPVKLSDHRISQYNEPIDFYRIIAVDQYGNKHYLENVTPDMTIVDYQIEYRPMFYDSMLYRAFMGYGPDDIGVEGQGIPGISGSLSNYPPMQAWNMTHFRLVYRTAYYNPYPEDMVADHPEAWRAVSYEEALSLKDKIGKGEIDGVVDYSPQTLGSAVVFLQYYEGAIITGTVTTETGQPFANAWVTVLDEYGIPHQTVKTDSDGHYEVIAPFGEVELVFSYGDLDLRTQIAQELDRRSFNITYDQAMRAEIDENHDGVWDYYIKKDVQLDGTEIKGRVYWDLDGNSEFGGDDLPLSNATAVIQGTDIDFRQEVEVDSGGQYLFEGLPPMTANLFISVENRSLAMSVQKILPMGSRTVDMPVRPCMINGTMVFENGQPASLIEVGLLDLISGKAVYTLTDEDGGFSFEMLLPGNYSLFINSSELSIGNQILSLEHGESVDREFTVYDAFTLTGHVKKDGKRVGNALVGILSDSVEKWVYSDAEGKFTAILPEGNYTVYSLLVEAGMEYVYLGRVSGAGEVSLEVELIPAISVAGKVYEGSQVLEGVNITLTYTVNGARLTAVTNNTGGYRAVIPAGRYFVYAEGDSGASWSDIYFHSSSSADISLEGGVNLNGAVWYDSDHDGKRDPDEGVAGVRIMVSDPEGRNVSRETDSRGVFSFTLVHGKDYTVTGTLEGYRTFVIYYTDLEEDVTEHIQLIPENRTLTGRTLLDAAPAGHIRINFIAAGGDAINATVESDANGRFTVSLSPGTYAVVVDQNVTPLNDALKYQNHTDIEVLVGVDPQPLDLNIVKRVKVEGEVTPDRNVDYTVHFDGPEKKEVETDGPFMVYLLEGEYDIYVAGSRADMSYVCLEKRYIDTGISPLTLVTVDGVNVAGILRYDNSTLLRSVPVTITSSSGAALEIFTESNGRFFTALPAGEYTVSVDYHTVDYISASRRFVRYYAVQSVEIAAQTTLKIDLQRGLDNSTLTGKMLSPDGVPVAGELTFIAISETAINASVTATASGYSLELAPGNYSVYARETGGPGVFFGVLEIDPYAHQEIDLTLSPGLKLSGMTFYGGAEGTADIVVRNDEGANIALSSRLDGYYEIYLPAGVYDVDCHAGRVERSIDVMYRAELHIDLEESTSRTITLEKVVEPGVELQWDDRQKVTVHPGEQAIYTVLVVNTGNAHDTFTLAAYGTSWGVEIEPSTVSLQFGHQNVQAVMVRINVPGDARVDHDPVTIRATSALDSGVRDTVSVDVNVLPVKGVNMSKDKAYPTEGKNYTLSIKIENTGNVEDTYEVRVSNAGYLESLGWKTAFENGTDTLEVTIDAGKPFYFDLSLLPLRANPDPNVEVILVARSVTEGGIQKVLPLAIDLPSVTVPESGLKVGGYDVYLEQPSIPLFTVGLAGFTIVMFTLMVLIGMQKGVFRRRRR